MKGPSIENRPFTDPQSAALPKLETAATSKLAKDNRWVVSRLISSSFPQSVASTIEAC
jgi:hypothetical protein